MTSSPKSSTKKSTNTSARVNALSRRSKEMDRGLEAIYTEPVGEVERQFSSNGSVRGARLVSGIVTLLGMCTLSAWAGWMWFGQTPSNVSPIEARLEAPSALVIGQPTRIRVTWKNESSSVLRRMRVQMLLPSHAEFVSAIPAFTDEKRSVWQREYVSGYATGTFDITVIPRGALNEETFVQALISSDNGSGSSQEQQPLVMSFTHSTSAVSLDRPVLPAHAIPGEKVMTTWSWSFPSSTSLGSAQLRIVYPETFQPAVATGTVLDPEHRTIVTSLDKIQSKTISLIGSFLPSHVEQGVFMGEIGRTDEHGTWLTFARTSGTMTIAPPDLALAMVVNGVEEGVVLEPNGVLRATLRYENTTPDSLEHVKLTVKFDTHADPVLKKAPTFIDARAFESNPRATTSTKGSVILAVFDEKTIPDFFKLRRGSSGSIDLYLPLGSVASGTRDLSIFGNVSGEFIRGKTKKTLMIPERIFAVSSDVSPGVAVRFGTEEGAPIVGGSMPPQVGVTTTYRVFFDLEKRLHAVENVVMKTTLAKHVSLHGTSSTSEGTLIFDPVSQTVTWSVPLFATNSSALHAWFDIDLVPTPEDVGQFVPLIGTTSFEGRDTTIERLIRRAQDGFTTDLEDDSIAKGKGSVRVRIPPSSSTKKSR